MMVDRSAPPQLYLMTPAISDAAMMAPALRAAMEAGPVACVLLTIAAGDDHATKKIVKDLAPLVQGKGAALLLNGWLAIIARSGADGVHVAKSRNQLREALETQKPGRIVGVAGIRSKHDAMTLADMRVAGEGVDYVMYGEPQGDGRAPPLADVVERTAWWAEIFQVPCVSFAPDLAAVPLLADAGADFIALGSAVWNHPKGPGAAVALASGLLAQRKVPT